MSRVKDYVHEDAQQKENEALDFNYREQLHEMLQGRDALVEKFTEHTTRWGKYYEEWDEHEDRRN